MGNPADMTILGGGGGVPWGGSRPFYKPPNSDGSAENSSIPETVGIPNRIRTGVAAVKELHRNTDGRWWTMTVADFHRDSGTLLVCTSKAGKLRHIELTAEVLDFFEQIAGGRSSAELLFHRDGTAWGKSHQQRPLSEACCAARISPAASFHTLPTPCAMPTRR